MSEHPEHTSITRSQRGIRFARYLAIVGVAVLAIGVTACGDDDDAASAEATFCEAGDSLQTDMDALVNFDVIAGGTEALSESFDAVKSDFEQLSDSGEEVAADDIEALQISLDDLGDAIDTLGQDVSVQGAADVGTAIQGVVDSANAVYETLSTTCS